MRWAKYTCARAKFRGETTRGERQKFLGASRPLEISRAHVCISLAPQSPSPKLDYSQCTVFLTVKLPTSEWQTRIKKSSSNSLTSIGIVRFDYFDYVVHQKRFRLKMGKCNFPDYYSSGDLDLRRHRNKEQFASWGGQE